MTNEVETILQEIRERVRTEEESRARLTPIVENGLSEHSSSGLAAAESQNNELLNRVSAHLTTTGRAWDRLPPVFSNRRGGSARIELWIKARMKSLSRWFTWEQINFNSAVHHALTDTQHALYAHAQALEQLRSELKSELEKEREDARGRAEQADRDLKAMRAAFEAQTTSLQARLKELQAEINARFDEKPDLELQTQLNARLAELAHELRTEQSVCFKQLSLEAGEAAVNEDRGRRAIQSRLEELEKRL